MTREEAIKFLVKDKKQRGDCFISDALDIAIKALKQEPILDKVKAEIKYMDFDFGDFYDHTETIIERVLEVIDKVESEGV